MCSAEPPRLRPLCSITLPQPGPRGSQGSCGWQGLGSRSPFLFQPLPGDPFEGSSCPNLMGRSTSQRTPFLWITAPSTPSPPPQLPRPAPLGGFIPSAAAAPRDAGTRKTAAAERCSDAAGGGSSRCIFTPHPPTFPKSGITANHPGPIPGFFKSSINFLKTMILVEMSFNPKHRAELPALDRRI